MHMYYRYTVADTERWRRGEGGKLVDVFSLVVREGDVSASGHRL